MAVGSHHQLLIFKINKQTIPYM